MERENAMLDQATTAQLTTVLERLKGPVELVATVDDGEASQKTRAFLADVAATSPMVSVRWDGTDARCPSFLIAWPGEDSGVRFAGVPLGHEFTSLILALLHVSGYPPKHDETLLEEVLALTGPLHFETYFSLTCQNCPDVVQALNTMAALNPNITHTAIEGGGFQDEIAAREVLSVPTVYLNGELFGQGRMTLAEILARLDTGSGARNVEALDARSPFDVLVLGGGPAAATAAIYASRKGLRTGVVTDRMGGQVNDTATIENFPSVPHTEGVKFGSALTQHVHDYDVDVMDRQQAVSLVPATSPGGPIGIALDCGATLSARAVLVATGARWRLMGVPGEQEYRNRGVTFCPHCDGPLFKGKPVAVIGGGNSGVEAAIDLAGICSHVTLVEFDEHLRADEVLQRKLRSLPNVTVITQGLCTQVLGDGSIVTGLTYTNRQDDTSHTLTLAGIFVQIGLLPNTDWLRGTLDLTKGGEIVVDGNGRTSIPGVFAAGDCTTVPFKQIVIAAGEGAKASLAAFDYLVRSDVGPEPTPIPAVASHPSVLQLQ
jgi:alkyl hydroperoxide reductase subunit F